jgi:hypothetical protein
VRERERGRKKGKKNIHRKRRSRLKDGKVEEDNKSSTHTTQHNTHTRTFLEIFFSLEMYLASRATSRLKFRNACSNSLQVFSFFSFSSSKVAKRSSFSACSEREGRGQKEGGVRTEREMMRDPIQKTDRKTTKQKRENTTTTTEQR